MLNEWFKFIKKIFYIINLKFLIYFFTHLYILIKLQIILKFIIIYVLIKLKIILKFIIIDINIVFLN
jgi:hypothetical protein